MSGAAWCAMPWSCGHCRTRRRLVFPAASDCLEREDWIELAHAAARPDCPTRWDADGLRAGEIREYTGDYGQLAQGAPPDVDLAPPRPAARLRK